MNGFSPMGALLGIVFSAGVLIVWRHLPGVRHVSLDQRISGYLRDPRDRHRVAAVGAVTPFPTAELIFAPYLSGAARRLERVLGGSASIRRRLDQLDGVTTLEQFRIEQVVAGAAGFGLGMAASLLLVATGRATSVPVLVFACLAAGVGGVLWRDTHLTVAVRKREQLMLAEFPTIADLLALSVAAGESPSAALARVSRTCHGELSRELSRCLAESRAGTPLVTALDRVAERTSLSVLARFTDGIAVALDRGTPLSDVLRAQASDVRDTRKRQLMEIGGRKEVAMMVPVVFAILPITVLFALYPGLIQVQSLVP